MRKQHIISCSNDPNTNWKSLNQPLSEGLKVRLYETKNYNFNQRSICTIDPNFSQKKLKKFKYK